MAIVEFTRTTPALGEPEPQLSPNALAVLEKRYLRKDETGAVIETPGQMFWRVAWNLAQADRLYGATEEQVWASAREFYRLLSTTEFLPNSPTLMNAGLDLQQLSACFVIPVEDSLDGIFDALKWQAKIHQSGGGCIGGDAHVYTTFCGIERIETLYERVRAGGVAEVASLGHRVMDISSLGIQTFAMDPSTGRLAPKQVTHLWRWDVPAEKQYVVRCRDGTTVTTSEWHPFLVVTEDGIVERRADELHPGGLLFTPNRSIRDSWPFSRCHEQDGLLLDERLSWLVGYSLGDGSLGWFNNRNANYHALRLRLFDGRPEAIAFARDVLADQGVFVTPGQDRRGLWRLTTTDRKFVPRFAKAACLEPGPKLSLTMPEWVAKSPLKVIAAFLAGLIDSDGYVSVKRRRVEFSTACPELARRLVSLLSALGMNPSMHPREPSGRRSRRTEYRIQMADAKKTHELVALVRPWIHDSFRGERMDVIRERVPHNTHDRIPVPFPLLERLLLAAGVETRGTQIHKGAIRVGEERLWLHRAKWGEGIGEDKLERLVRALRPLVPPRFHGLLDQLENLSGGWAVVESVARVTRAEPFYDFTVADYNNYLAGAGSGKLTVVHNTGFGFSRLRPKGDFVKSTMGVASGPVSFMRIFDASTQTVKQGGKRRGANMGILRVDHPDILEFIACKDDLTQVTNFNISVAVTDRFMDAVRKGETYDVVNPRSNQVVASLDARSVFDKIAYQAWKNGEPGLFFIDTTNKTNPCPHITDFEATNPCGEQPLLPFESCNLGSLDLDKHMTFAGGKWDVDWKKLEASIRTSVHLLDNVIDANAYPIPQIDEMTKMTRKIGLGVMGFARMLFKLGVAYDSPEGVEWGRRIMKFVKDVGYDESGRLAEVRGVYPAWKGSRHEKMGIKVRNSYVTTVAPTGTLSMIADTSGGCEPEFSLIWYKNVMDGTHLPYVLEYFIEAAKRGGWWRDDLLDRILKNGGSCRGLREVPEKWQRAFAVSFDVSPESHVRMQAAFQESCDAAVSKTINLPATATVDDVKRAYLLAYELGCKGITVYRDQSRKDQVMNVGVSEKEKPQAEIRVDVPTPAPAPQPRTPRPRPDVITGRTQKVMTGYGAVYVTINEDEQGLFEIFAQSGRGGGYTASFTEALARLVSLCLRSGIPADEIIDQLEGIRSPRISYDHAEHVLSIPDAIAKALKRHIGAQATGVQKPVEAFEDLGGVETDSEADKEARDDRAIVKAGLNPECPECGRVLVFEEGCVRCHSCGYSEC